MKNKSIAILIMVLSYIIKAKGNKGMSKFERMFKECSSTPQCMRRPNDDNCLYKCVSSECYDELIGNNNLLIEYGEIDTEFKKTFEKCHGFKNREKASRTKNARKGTNV